MSEELNIEVQTREETGKNVNRRLRAAGKVPAVVYGGGRDTVAIVVDRKTVRDLLRDGSDNAIFLLKRAESDQQRHARIRELQTDVITREIVHIDFQRVLMDEKLKVMVAVELEGEPSGVRNEGGVLDHVTRELEVECLPSDIPERFVYDVSKLEIGDHVEANAIEMPKGVELLEEPDRVIAAVSYADRIEVEEEDEEGLLEAEQAEPEVIGKGKDDEDEDSGDEA